MQLNNFSFYFLGEIKVGSSKLYPSLENPCRLYYICIPGGFHLMGSCPQKQSFDASKKKCQTTKDVPNCANIQE